MNIKRVFLIVLDSVGIGELPDADLFNDCGSNTMRTISKSKKFNIPALLRLGLSNIEGTDYLQYDGIPAGTVARMKEKSAGKDTIIGHWEISGIISENPLPTYPNGFPDEITENFKIQTGRGILCNKPYSGTEVINTYGKKHMETGDLIVYTSADSVFQIAAHEEIVPVEELYRYCSIARKILVGKHGVGRVIARPFIGSEGNFTRTSNRHDFSLEPPSKTMLDCLNENGFDVISVGKIFDIFSGKGITEKYLTKGNADGMAVTERIAKKDFNGLCFINLVDFDMLYGHRNDVDGYANALSEFDSWLAKFLPTLNNDDVLMITADHGCDPSTASTDHSREYTPLIIFGNKIKAVNLGTRSTFADIGATVLQMFGVKSEIKGCGFFKEIVKGD